MFLNIGNWKHSEDMLLTTKATVDVCAIRSRKILSCGLPAAVPYALKLARIMPFCPFPEPDRGRRATTEDALPSLLAIL